MTDLVLRNVKGAALTWDEGDQNLRNLDSDSPWNVAAGHIWYSGKVSLYGDDATYDLDFTDGVANVATIGTNDADLEVHVDGARQFKIFTNTQERFKLTTDGKVGINFDSYPKYELDVDGNIRSSVTVFANQVSASSLTDGIASLSGGNLYSAVNAEFTGQVRFGSLYDIGNDHIIRQLDVSTISDFDDRIPTSKAVFDEIASFGSDVSDRFDSLQQNIDSVNNSLISNVNQLQTNIDSVNTSLQNNVNILQGNIDSVNNSLIINVDQLQNSLDSVSSNLSSTNLQDVTDVGSSTTRDITAPHFVGQLTGTLTNPRFINGTSFDASSNIITSVWGTGRDISIGGTSKSVDGSGNYTWTKAEIQANNADQLTNGRNINGTLFDGTSNITTTTWGAARDISIGGTSKSVNGSGNYTWTSGEITAGKVSNSFTVQGTSFDGSSPQSVTFSGGTGITVTGTTITNSAPDQTVSITGGGATTVSGTYPNFTVSSTDTIYTLPLATAGARGGVKIGYAANGKNYPVALSAEQMYVSVPWTDTVYTLPLAASGTRGGVQVGYATSGKNYAVQLSGEKMFVNVPWTDNNTTYTAGTGLSLVGTQFTNTAPDRTVTLTGAGTTTVTGTYPNFTITSTSASYTLPLATNSVRGGVQIGYSTNGKNYAVQLSGEKMYVNVPWSNTNTTYTAGNGLSLNGTQFLMSGSYTGTFTATGDVVAFSDMALKEDINPIGAALEKVTQLTGYTFRRKGEQKVSTGVMAQEVQKVLPEAVHDNEGTLGVAYGNMVGLLIEAVKELSGKVESLESELNRIK